MSAVRAETSQCRVAYFIQKRITNCIRITISCHFNCRRIRQYRNKEKIGNVSHLTFRSTTRHSHGRRAHDRSSRPLFGCPHKTGPSSSESNSAIHNRRYSGAVHVVFVLVDFRIMLVGVAPKRPPSSDTLLGYLGSRHTPLFADPNLQFCRFVIGRLHKTFEVSGFRLVLFLLSIGVLCFFAKSRDVRCAARRRHALLCNV